MKLATTLLTTLLIAPLAALWMVHWSDADGRLCRGQLVEVTNPQGRSKSGVTPATFFTDGSTWGRAIYIPKK